MKEMQAPPDQITMAAEYRQASPVELRRAQIREIGRALKADWGQSLLQATTFATQVVRRMRGEDVEIDWEPEVAGMDPDLDRLEHDARERLRAIQRELSLRRTTRQRVFEKNG